MVARVMPLFTIVIPTLDCRHVIDKALDSLLAQSLRDFEVILADGASSDGTVAHAIARLSEAAVPWHCIVSPGAGIYAAMNQATQLASGQWIQFLGSDDNLCAPETLARIAEHVRISRADVVHGDAWIEDPGYAYGGEFGPRRLVERNLSHQSAFYRTAALRRWRPVFKEQYRIFADWDLNLRLRARGRFEYVPQLIASFGCEGLSSRQRDQLFLAEKEANAIDYFGIRSFWLLPLDRLALGCAIRPTAAKSALLLLARGLRSSLRRLRALSGERRGLGG